MSTRGLENFLTDPAEVKVRIQKQKMMMNSTLKSQMRADSDKREQIFSAERAKD